MTITPRFEADIGADISKFMQRANTVDKKIRELATGVVVDVTANIREFMSDASVVQSTVADITRDVDITVTGDISDFQREIAEANAELTALRESAEVNINGNRSGFDDAARGVRRETNSLRRRITEARIGADIGSFENRMVDVMRSLTEAGDTVTPRIEADVTDFTRDITNVQDRMREIARTTADPEVEADIAGFMAQMALVQAQLNGVIQTHDIDIRADTGSAHARLSALWLQIRSLTARDFVMRVRARWSNYQDTMGAIANFSRSIGEVMAMTGRGIMISLSPAIVPLLGSLALLIGNLGPMLGTVAGSTFAFATALGAAGLGLGGFAAVAAPTIKDLFDIDEAVKRGSKEWYAMSKETRNAVDSIDAFQGNWGHFREEMDKPITTAFTDFMQTSNKLLDLFKPAIEGSVAAVGNLMKSLETAVEGNQVKSFFEWLGTAAGQHLETLGKGLGNFLLGFMNMMTAFGPLAETTAAGFARMGEGFAEWSAGLSKSKGFQNFVDYVNENMPKIRSIFSDAIQGVIDLFAQFGPSSSDMMTSLQDMMERFKEWAATLENNQAFQNFMDYIKESGPKVVELIGNIKDILVEITQALAPAGAVILDIANAVMDFTGKLLENHPWIGKVGAALLIMGGAFLAILPNVVALNSLLGGLITKMIVWVAKTTWAAAVQVAKWIWMGVTATANAIRMAAAWTLATGVKMVVAVAKMIASAAVFVARWTMIAVQATFNAIKVAAAWALSTGVAMVTAIAKMVASAAVFVARWVFMGVQALLHAAKMAAAWFIALGPIGWVTGAIIAIVALVIANWDKVSAWTKKAWTVVSTAVSNAVAKIMSWIEEKFPALYNIIQSYMTMAKEVISAIWNYIKGTFSNVLSFLKSLVKGDFQGMKDAISNQMELAKSTISRIWNAVKSYLSTLLGTL